MKLIKCSECGKEYDYKLDVCPNCGYVNKIKKFFNIIFYIISTILLLISLLSVLENIYANKCIKEMQEYIVKEDLENLSSTFELVAKNYKIQNYYEMYGSKEYGEKAYNLNNLRMWSMSFCIVTIWFGIYLKKKNIKIGNIIKYIAIVVFIVFQLLHFGYVIYVRNIKVEDNTNITNSNELIELKEH